MTGKNRIMIYGPKDDGTHVVEFRTADGDVLAISIPRNAVWPVRPGGGYGRYLALGREPINAQIAAPTFTRPAASVV